jgi:hypothetical protein
MASDSNRSSSFHLFQDQAERDLLQLILHDLKDEAPYPWNPAEMGSEAYFAESEQSIESEWAAEELAAKGQSLATQLNQMWLCSDLTHRFSAQVPHQLLESIVQRAQQMITANLSIADRLVQCVQDLVPGWGEEDLLVLARPFAYAMRDRKTTDLDAVPQLACWTELSSIEQARLSLAIAHYAIAKLPTSEDQQ